MMGYRDQALTLGGADMSRNEEITRLIDSYLEEELPAADKELPPNVRRALACIHKQLLDEKMTVNQIYRNCRIKEHNFAAKFAHYLGKPPKQYILHHRLEVAKRLLSHPKLRDMRISTVAFEVGFSRFSAFSMAFKHKTGITPSRWKKNNHSDNGKN